MPFTDRHDGTAVIENADGTTIELVQCTLGKECSDADGNARGWIKADGDTTAPCWKCKGLVRCPGCGRGKIDPAKYRVCYDCFSNGRTDMLGETKVEQPATNEWNDPQWVRTPQGFDRVPVTLPQVPRNAPEPPSVGELNAVFGRQGRPPDEVNDARGEIIPPGEYARPRRTKEKLPPFPEKSGEGVAAFAADYGL